MFPLFFIRIQIPNTELKGLLPPPFPSVGRQQGRVRQAGRGPTGSLSRGTALLLDNKNNINHCHDLQVKSSPTSFPFLVKNTGTSEP